MKPSYIERAEDYLNSKDMEPNVINIKNTFDDMGILEIYILGGAQKYIFSGITAKCYEPNGRKWREMCDASDDWQAYLLKNAIGNEKLDILLAIKDRKNQEYFRLLSDFLRNYKDYVFAFSDEMGESEINCDETDEVMIAHQTLLDIEEKCFSFYLATTNEDEYQIENVIRKDRASYAELHTAKIQDFLDHEVQKGINEKGEEVYEFTEEQFAVYEILKELRESTDFMFRHQLYKLDQKKLREEENL